MAVSLRTQSLEERVLYLLSPFRPPFAFIKPTGAEASVKEQLFEQLKTKVLAQNITFLIRNSERTHIVAPDDVFFTTWGFKMWAEGSKGGALALLVREAGKSHMVLSVPLIPGGNVVDKMAKEVDNLLEAAIVELPAKAIEM